MVRSLCPLCPLALDWRMNGQSLHRCVGLSASLRLSFRASEREHRLLTEGHRDSSVSSRQQILLANSVSTPLSMSRLRLPPGSSWPLLSIISHLALQCDLATGLSASCSSFSCWSDFRSTGSSHSLGQNGFWSFGVNGRVCLYFFSPREPRGSRS